MKYISKNENRYVCHLITMQVHSVVTTVLPGIHGPQPKDCLQVQAFGGTTSGVYTIYPEGGPVNVFCDMETEGGGWTVGRTAYILRIVQSMCTVIWRQGAEERYIEQHISRRVDLSWSNDSQPTVVIEPVYGIPTFPLTANAV